MFFTISIVLWFMISLPSTLTVSIDNKGLLLKRHVEPNDIQFFNQGVRSSLSYLYQKRERSDSDNELILKKKKGKKKIVSTDTSGNENTTDFASAQEFEKWEGDREGWQISAGLYFDKAIASDSCDSDSEEEGRKKFWIFTDDAPLENEIVDASSKDELEFNYIPGNKSLDSSSKEIPKVDVNSTIHNQSKIKFNFDVTEENQFESGFGSVVSYNCFYLYILLFCIFF